MSPQGLSVACAALVQPIGRVSASVCLAVGPISAGGSRSEGSETRARRLSPRAFSTPAIAFGKFFTKVDDIVRSRPRALGVPPRPPANRLASLATPDASCAGRQKRHYSGPLRHYPGVLRAVAPRLLATALRATPQQRAGFGGCCNRRGCPPKNALVALCNRARNRQYGCTLQPRLASTQAQKTTRRCPSWRSHMIYDPITFRLPAALHDLLEKEARARRTSQAKVVIAALEKELLGDRNEVMYELLRSALMARELAMDMSSRTDKEKDALWEAMTTRARELLASRTEQDHAAAGSDC